MSPLLNIRHIYVLFQILGYKQILNIKLQIFVKDLANTILKSLTIKHEISHPYVNLFLRFRDASKKIFITMLIFMSDSDLKVIRMYFIGIQIYTKNTKEATIIKLGLLYSI